MSEENISVGTVEPASSPQPPASAVAALPEADLPEPPRPLVAGAFLGGEYEVKDLIERGLTNYYLAFGGDPSAPVLKLVAEREKPAEAAAESTPDHESPSLLSWLFSAAQHFAAEDREYLIFDWVETIPLRDWRENSNDGRYLQALSTLVSGMHELENLDMYADWSLETLRFDARGELKYFGFVEPLPAGIEENPLVQLREINSFLLRTVFAEAATMRLDDEWGALAMSEEVKHLARLISSPEATLERIEAELQALHGNGNLRADAALITDVGREREVNEDAGMILRLSQAGHTSTYDIEVYAVSDGMGGHEGGEVASHLTLTTLQNSIGSRLHLDWDDNVAVRAAMWEMIDEVNAAVLQLTEEPRYRAARAKPGATLTFAIRLGSRLFLGNVGDSRAYKWSALNGLQRVTVDHSYVQTLLDSGQITAEEAWEHPESSIITSHIGMSKLKLRDVFLRLAVPGDKLLLVSDGVVDMLRESEIEPLLHEDNPRAICRSLVEASNAAGGHDNITAVCVNFS